jgi:AraC-like DNA-binding protein
MRRSQRAAGKARLLLLKKDPSMAPGAAELLDPRPEMVCFRGQTLALVRHFFEISSQVGRISSLLGREFFRSRVSHHAIPSFEEQAVFARDIELCLEKLSSNQAGIITLMGLYDLSDGEVANMCHCSRRYVRDQFAEAVDCLSEIFLETDLLRENHPDRKQRQPMDDGTPRDVVGSRRKPPRSVRPAPELRAVKSALVRNGGAPEPQLA